MNSLGRKFSVVDAVVVEYSTIELFGIPTVPLAWDGDFCDDELFFCQIKLSDIAHLDTENILPHSGYLYIFLHTEDGKYHLGADVRYHDGQPELAAAFLTMYKEEIRDSSGMIYNALKARNYYVDDDCGDIRKQALLFISKELVDDVFDTVMKRRRNLRHDPVEMTEEYLAVIDEVGEKIERKREYRGFGSCHHLWSLKTDYLAEKGVAWKSPVVLNPRVRFD